MKLTNKLKVNCIKCKSYTSIPQDNGLTCKSYTSIPQDNGLTDYCIEKNKFVKSVVRYCRKYKERKF